MYAVADPVAAYQAAKGILVDPHNPLQSNFRNNAVNPTHGLRIPLTGADLQEFERRLTLWADGEVVCMNSGNYPTPVPTVTNSFPVRCNTTNLVSFVQKVWYSSSYPYGLKSCVGCHSGGNPVADQARGKFDLNVLTMRYDYQRCQAVLARVNLGNPANSLLLNLPAGCNGRGSRAFLDSAPDWLSWITETSQLPP